LARRAIACTASTHQRKNSKKRTQVWNREHGQTFGGAGGVEIITDNKRKEKNKKKKKKKKGKKKKKKTRKHKVDPMSHLTYSVS